MRDGGPQRGRHPGVQGRAAELVLGRDLGVVVPAAVEGGGAVPDVAQGGLLRAAPRRARVDEDALLAVVQPLYGEAVVDRLGLGLGRGGWAWGAGR